MREGSLAGAEGGFDLASYTKRQSGVAFYPELMCKRTSAEPLVIVWLLVAFARLGNASQYAIGTPHLLLLRTPAILQLDQSLTRLPAATYSPISSHIDKIA